jgi:hypothetical protein
MDGQGMPFPYKIKLYKKLLLLNLVTQKKQIALLFSLF